ncbi:hypothetical protein BDK51DRAFT_39924, partial [Blyttiomyces helicus]
MPSPLPTPQPPHTFHSSPPPPQTFSSTYRNSRPLLLKESPHILPLARKCSQDPSFLQNELLTPIQSAAPESIADASKGLLNVLISSDNEHFLDDPRFATKKRMHVSDILAGVTSPSPPTERFYYRGGLSPTLLSTLSAPTILTSLTGPTPPPTKPSLIRIWISPAGARTPLHFDRCHGILIQLSGRKRFLIFPPSDARALALHDGISGPAHASRIRGLDAG